MDFQMDPFPIETEFQVLTIKRRLKDLSREELEQFLTEALVLMAKLTHQVTQLHDFVMEEAGKTREN